MCAFLRHCPSKWTKGQRQSVNENHSTVHCKWNCIWHQSQQVIHWAAESHLCAGSGPRASSPSQATFSLARQREEKTSGVVAPALARLHTPMSPQASSMAWPAGHLPWCRVFSHVPSTSMQRETPLLGWGKGSMVEGKHLCITGGCWILTVDSLKNWYCLQQFNAVFHTILWHCFEGPAVRLSCCWESIGGSPAILQNKTSSYTNTHAVKTVMDFSLPMSFILAKWCTEASVCSKLSMTKKKHYLFSSL